MNQYFENNNNLKSDVKINKENINGTEFYFYTDNGVFNKKGLDFGTRLLLESIDYSNKSSFLDIGCGCGPIGIYISNLSDGFIVDMVDVNDRAIHLCKRYIKENKKTNLNVFKSDIYENVDSKYDCIITNPPIHAGKTKVYEIINNAKDHLNNNGELWIVMRKDQGALSMMRDFSDVFTFEVVKKSKGFLIIKAFI